MEDRLRAYYSEFRRLSTKVTRFYDSMVEECGVTTNQYLTLRYISELNEGTIRELSDRSGMDKSTLTRTLKPLFERELIVDTKAPRARNSKLELTEQGREIMKKADRQYAKARRQLEQKLGKENLEKFESVLDAVDNL